MSIETWIYAGMLAVAIPGALVAVRKLRRPHTTSTPPSAPHPPPSRETIYVVERESVVVSRPDRDLEPGPIAPTASSTDPTSAQSNELQANEPPPPEREVCEVGPYTVTAGQLTKVVLSVSPGDRITGTLEADDDFDYSILTQRNYVRLLSGEDPPLSKYGELERAYEINWKVRGKGPWVLVLSAPRRRYPREVEVNLERHR